REVGHGDRLVDGDAALDRLRLRARRLERTLRLVATPARVPPEIVHRHLEAPAALLRTTTATTTFGLGTLAFRLEGGPFAGLAGFAESAAVFATPARPRAAAAV